MHASTRAWIENMQLSAEGIAFLSNMLHDYLELQIDTSIVCKFLESVGKWWEGCDPSEIPESGFDIIIGLALNEYCCKGKKVPKDYDGYSRVMSIQQFMLHNFEYSRTGYANRGHLTEKQIKDIERFGLHGCVKGKMETRRPYSWITKTKEIKILRKLIASNELPSKIRCELGLLHYQKDEHLIEIRFPKDKIKDYDIFIPTFLEGGPSLIYRSKNSSDDWGRAVNLDTLKDGLPEAIHPSIPFTEEFQFLDIGKLQPFEHSFGWDKFLLSFPHPWEIDSINHIC